jgi:hypothetical protein
MPSEPTCCPILELRQYTLHPGARDTLIRIFDREFVESQEALGMRIVGQFRDVDDAERFVWVRGFADMASRAEGLAAFYGGPVWKAHAREANATMVDSDDVLLLRPVDAGAGFRLGDLARPPVGADEQPRSLVVATICHRATPVDDEFVTFFDRDVEPVLRETGGAPVARLRTEYAENTFPALPVRTGEHVFVWFATFAGPDAHREHTDRLAEHREWRDTVLPRLLSHLSAAPQPLRLLPTARSLLR